MESRVLAAEGPRWLTREARAAHLHSPTPSARPASVSAVRTEPRGLCSGKTVPPGQAHPACPPTSSRCSGRTPYRSVVVYCPTCPYTGPRAP